MKQEEEKRNRQSLKLKKKRSEETNRKMTESKKAGYGKRGKYVLYQLYKHPDSSIRQFGRGGTGIPYELQDATNLQCLRRFRAKGLVSMTIHKGKGRYSLTEEGMRVAEPIVKQMDDFVNNGYTQRWKKLILQLDKKYRAIGDFRGSKKESEQRANRACLRRLEKKGLVIAITYPLEIRYGLTSGGLQLAQTIIKESPISKREKLNRGYRLLAQLYEKQNKTILDFNGSESVKGQRANLVSLKTLKEKGLIRQEVNPCLTYYWLTDEGLKVAALLIKELKAAQDKWW